ncbi:MAG TPA: redoxin domain-containing protein [Bryobacteraceae bacterium]|nr:redoxin domain-containing protein [Bryobacteraceae bacterium]
MTAPLVFLLLLGSSEAGVPLLAGCSAGDERLAVIAVADRVEVRQAISSSDGTCYRLDLIRADKKISGYVLGESLPAVAAFAAERERIDSQRLPALVRGAAGPSEATPQPSGSGRNDAKAAEPNFAVPEYLSDFVARDVEGRPHHLSSLPGRLIVVAFWSGRSKAALGDLQAIYNQYKHRGVSVVGINIDGARMLARETEDVDLGFPQWADPGGIAQHYGVGRSGKAFVLDRSRRVLAAGSSADAARAVKQLMSAKTRVR